MSEPNTFIDGCGLFADTPIGENTRIRFRLAEDRQQDISVCLEDGVLHIYGMYRPLILRLTPNDNHVRVDTKVWTMKCPRCGGRKAKANELALWCPDCGWEVIDDGPLFDETRIRSRQKGKR